MGMKLVTVLLPQPVLDVLDDLVRANLYKSRSDAIRSAVKSEFIEPKSGKINPVLTQTMDILKSKTP